MTDKIREALAGMLAIEAIEAQRVKIDQRIAAACAALARPPAQAVPDGWKMVPVEPTVEILAAHDALPFHQITTPEEVWAAMLAAAPAAPVAQGFDALCGIEWKPQGEANEYILLRGARWVAGVRFNGELLPEAQEEILKAMLCDKTVRYGGGFHMGYWKGRADLASEQQPDTVAVPRELLERAMYAENGSELIEANRELRALLAGVAE